MSATRRRNRLAATLMVAGAAIPATGNAQNEVPVVPDPALGRYIVIVVLLIATSALFYYLFDWWRGIDRSSANYQVFKDAIFNREFAFLRVSVDVKYKSGAYVQELLQTQSERAIEWLGQNVMPAAPPQLRDLAETLRVRDIDRYAPDILTSEENYIREKLELRFVDRQPPMAGSAGGSYGSPSSPMDEEERKEREALQRDFSEKRIDFFRTIDLWVDRAEAQIKRWYEDDLKGPREIAERFAESEVRGSDFASLRGRGPEFILEFTAVVILIISATILGLSSVLQNQQIGTLLAAIAGYVLGKGTTRQQGVAPNERRRPEPTPGSQS